jgi:hypothetical protein
MHGTLLSRLKARQLQQLSKQGKSGFLSIHTAIKYKPAKPAIAPLLARFIENLARFAKSFYFLAT